MLHTELVLKGPNTDYNIPKKFSVGKYLIECLTKRDAEDIFCVDGVTNETLTSGEYVRQTLKVVHLLREIGIQKGDIVTMVTENSLKFVIVYTAVMYMGAVVNPLNPLYKTGELLHVLNMTKPKLIFCSKIALETVKAVKSELDFIKQIILMDKVLESRTHDLEGVDILDTLLELSEVDVDTVEPAEFDSSEHIAAILLSSGTTGLPKGVMITHSNARMPLCYFSDRNIIGATPKDVLLGVLPFFHILGGSIILTAAECSTKLIVIPSFQPELFLKCIQKYKISILFTVPPILGFLAKHPLVKKFDLSCVRKALCSGGALGRELQEQFTKEFPKIEVLVVYGLTEATGYCTYVPEDTTNKHGSIGTVVPCMETMVWSKNAQENVGPNVSGELCYRGPGIMKGYIGNEENDIDEHNFYHTGDMGYYDDDGYFYLVGRMKELIKYKGFQVAPAELEDLLLKHPAVKECAVIGVQDERAGQLPTALVVLQNNMAATEEEIVDFVAGKISEQKHLHGGVKFIDSVPRNAAGKILREQLLELYKER